MAHNAAMAARQRLVQECVYVPGKGMVPTSDLTIEDYQTLLEDMRKRPYMDKVVADLEAKIAALTEKAEAEDIDDDITEDVEDDPIERAIRAYCTRERRAGHVVQQPAYIDCYTFNPQLDYLNGNEHIAASDLGDRRTYVVLRNVNVAVVAVYRTKDDGHIEFVKPEWWPATLTEAE